MFMYPASVPTAKCVFVLLTSKHHAAPDVTGTLYFGRNVYKSCSVTVPRISALNNRFPHHANDSIPLSTPVSPTRVFSINGAYDIFQISIVASALKNYF